MTWDINIVFVTHATKKFPLYICIGSDIVLLLCLHGYAAPAVVSKNGFIRLLMLDGIWMPLFITKASVVILHA